MLHVILVTLLSFFILPGSLIADAASQAAGMGGDMAATQNLGSVPTAFLVIISN